MSNGFVVLVIVLVVIAAVTALVLFKLPMRRPEGTLKDRAQWFAQARAARGEAPEDDEPFWDGKQRRPNLEGESGAGLL